jgi:hypothetical protein
MDIERGLPIPPPHSNLVRHPFGALKVGDSISRPVAEQNSFRAAASQYKIRHPGWDYTSRAQGDLVRLWCIAVPETERT